MSQRMSPAVLHNPIIMMEDFFKIKQIKRSLDFITVVIFHHSLPPQSV